MREHEYRRACVSEIRVVRPTPQWVALAYGRKRATLPTAD